LSAERLARKAAEREQRLAQEKQRLAQRPVKLPRGQSVKPLWRGSEGLRVRPCIGPLSAEMRRDEPPFAR
jgi:hypothetical protein